MKIQPIGMLGDQCFQFGADSGILDRRPDAHSAVSFIAATSSRNSFQRRPHSRDASRSEEPTSELQSLMRISYAVFCLKKKKKQLHRTYIALTTDIARHS